MPAKLYSSQDAQGPWDAIIIGSGLGGLATAVLMSKAGKRVLVLEKHYAAGGFTHTFTRSGFEFDVGVHYVGDVGRDHSVLRKIFDYVSDARLKWAEMNSVYDRVVIGDQVFDFVQGHRNWRAQLLEYFPDQEKALDLYLTAIRELTGGVKDFFSTKVMPQFAATLLRPFLAKNFHKWAQKTTAQVLREITPDPLLRGVLTAQWGDYGLPPEQSSFAIHAMVVKHYLEGGFYPVGGSSQFAETMIPAIEATGGAVLVKAGVEQILLKNGKAVGVKLENGSEVFASQIISDAGVDLTYNRLLPEEAKSGLKEKVKIIPSSFSHVCVYVGLNATAEELNLPKTNYWIYPTAEHDQNVARYLQDPETDLPAVYLSFPSAKDPDFLRRYPGKSTIEVIGFAPYEWFTSWENTKWKRRGDDYESFKKKLTDRYLGVLEKFFPQVRGKIVLAELSTPLSTRHFCQYQHGEIYGLSHTPERFNQKWLRPKTPIPGLYLTGQDVVSAGLGGALFSGVLTASVAMQQPTLLNKILKDAPSAA